MYHVIHIYVLTLNCVIMTILGVIAAIGPLTIESKIPYYFMVSKFSCFGGKTVVSDTMHTILYTDLIPGRGGDPNRVFQRHLITSACGFSCLISDILVCVLIGTNMTAEYTSFIGFLYIVQTGALALVLTRASSQFTDQLQDMAISVSPCKTPSCI